MAESQNFIPLAVYAQDGVPGGGQKPQLTPHDPGYIPDKVPHLNPAYTTHGGHTTDRRRGNGTIFTDKEINGGINKNPR